MTRIKLKDRILPAYTKGEEIFNMTSHIVGGAFGIVVTVLCVVFAAIHKNVYGIVSGAIYGTTMIMLYTMSSIYHGLSPKRKAKKVFQVLDHCSIFLLIAGSYTAFTLIALRSIDPTKAWIIFSIVWGIAILGTISYAIFKNKFKDIAVMVELTLSLLKNLLQDVYNSKLERVLRFSIYLLNVNQSFSFHNLRILILDMEYRNDLLRNLKKELPASVSYFFLTEFNELKTNSYNEAIAPIISFIDEMEMVPVFNNDTLNGSVEETLKNNQLSIFSLSRIHLGEKVIKTIAGFLIQQIFLD